MTQQQVPDIEEKTIYYFGYGANRSKNRLVNILNHSPIGGYGGIIRNFGLGYQTLTQIPDPPRTLLKRVWGEQYKGYTIIPAEGGIVAGVVWEIDECSFERMKEWECVSIWKKIIPVSVQTYNNRNIQAVTEIIMEPQRILWLVDGIDYENNLNIQNPRRNSRSDEFKVEQLRNARKTLQKMTLD